MRRINVSLILLLLAGFAALPAHAHDPYEITATASVLSNRFEVRAARLLAGLGWPTNQIDEAAEFTAMKPALEKAAENFFQVSTAGKNLPVDSVAVQLGVENHVTFTVEFPAVGSQRVVISVPGLALLAPEGQYGVGLTVLDMVRKKVLGQHVFTAANPLAQAAFGPPAEEIFAAQKTGGVTATVSSPVKLTDQTEPLKPETKPLPKSPLLWPWFVAAAGIILAAWLRRRG